MLFLYFLAFCPVLVAVGLFTYGSLKLPRQDVNTTRAFIYDVDENGTLIPLVIGHRGGQHEAPENTLQAVRTAHSNGATAVELDLDFTLDHIPIIIHDDTVDRTTDGNGSVANMTYENIKKLNAAAKARRLIFRGNDTREIEYEPIPTLNETVSLCIELGMKIILDVKSNPNLTAQALKALGETDERVYSIVMVTSFYPEVLYYVRKEDPKYLTGLIWRFQHSSRTISGVPKFSGIKLWLYEAFEFMFFYIVHTVLPDFLGLSAVSMHKDHISMRYLRQWRNNGIEVIAWTVNHPVEKEYFLKYYRVPVITDSVLNMLECPEQTS